MNIQVEFTGAARDITGIRTVTLVLSETATYVDVIRRLAELYPGLVGTIINLEHNALLSAMIFDRNGGEAILPGMLDANLRDGDRLMLMYFIVGG